MLVLTPLVLILTIAYKTCLFTRDGTLMNGPFNAQSVTRSSFRKEIFQSTSKDTSSLKCKISVRFNFYTDRKEIA